MIKFEDVMNSPNEIQFRNKLNKTFARRIGKRLSDYNKNLLENVLPKYQYSPEALLNSPKNKKFLEIGFGMGEHIFNQITLHPDNLYIGAEVYLNGVANFLKLATNVNNFLLWPNDLDHMLSDMPDKLLDGIYVLFPDPWHKRKYLKKRLVNKERLEFFKAKLKPGGFIIFASDIEDYFEDVRKLFTSDTQLKIQNTNFLIHHDEYVITKYHQKAIREGRDARFIQVILEGC